MSDLAEHASRATTVAIIRKKVMASLTRRGIRATKVNAVTLRLDSGGYVGLDNLVDRCLNYSNSSWNDVVEAHVTTLLDMQKYSDPAHIASMPDDEFYMRLRERVAPASLLRQLSEFSYTRPLVDAFDSPRRMLNLTFPDLALTLPDVALVGRDLETAWAFGRANTAAMKFDRRESMIKDNITIDVLRGDSIYLASKVADMPTFIDRYLDEAPFGVLFTIPNAYEIDNFLPRTFEETARAAELMVGVAQMLSRDTPNPLSDHVYFWRDGEYCQVTGDASAGVFAATLRELHEL